MADLKDLAEGVATKASIAAGKDAAKRALDDLLLSDEEKAERAAVETRDSKGRRWKLVAIAVLGLFLIVGVIGLVLNYWQWFLAAGVLGLVGLYAWWRMRRRLGKKAEPAVETVAPARVATESPKERLRAPDPAEAAEAQARAKEAREARAKELAEARAQSEAEVDEELAAMKARLKK